MHSQANSFSRSVSKHFDEYFKEYGLATSYVEVLICLKENGPLLQKEIADQLHLDPSTITRFLKKLQKNGWVDKKKDEGRTKVILNSDKIRDIDKLHKLYSQAENELNEILGEKFVETTQKLLEHGNTLLDQSKIQKKT